MTAKTGAQRGTRWKAPQCCGHSALQHHSCPSPPWLWSWQPRGEIDSGTSLMAQSDKESIGASCVRACVTGSTPFLKVCSWFACTCIAPSRAWAQSKLNPAVKRPLPSFKHQSCSYISSSSQMSPLSLVWDFPHVRWWPEKELQDHHDIIRWEKTISFCLQVRNEVQKGPPAHAHPRVLQGGWTQRHHLPSQTSCPDKGKCGLQGNYRTFRLEMTNSFSSWLWLRDILVFGNGTRDRTFMGSIWHLPAVQITGIGCKQYFKVLWL